MKRKACKLILLTAGLLLFLTGLVFLALFGIKKGNSLVFILSILSSLPISIVFLMHSKDIAGIKKGLSAALKAIAYYWLAFMLLTVILMSVLYFACPWIFWGIFSFPF